MKSSTIQRVALFLFLIFTVWLSFYVIQPPEPKPKSSSPTSFSAERAFKHIEQVAQTPHPLGSAANDSVMHYIIDELQELGLEPTIRKGVAVGSHFDSGLLGYTKNIFAKIPGHNPEKTILLMSHYDSVPNAPGAADDGSGVAAILEAIRAIKAQDNPLKNNIWILLTDGEERGLLGAEFFVNEFDELNQIDLVLNFEARGTSGASMMFETSAPNSKLIPHLAQGTPDPVANSLMYTVYKLLPNDTDLSVTKRAGLNGLNFAFAEDYLDYHTMQDNPENLSLASLQHHGSNLLGNVRHFGNTNFDLNSDSEYVYFNNATGGLIYYPSGWSFPLAVVAALLFIAYIIFLFRTNQLTFGSYLGSILLFIGMLTVSAAITYFGWQGFKLINPEYQWLAQGEIYSHKWYFWGFSMLVIALFSSVYGYNWMQKKISIQQFLAGSYTVWMLVSLVSAWYLPTASYFFTWPALLALVGWIVLGDNLNKESWKSTAILAVSLSGVLFILPPYLYLVQVMLTTEMLAVSMALLVFILGLAWPMIRRIIQDRKVILNSTFLVIAAGCFLIASVNSGFDTEHKKQNDINYVQNIDTGQAYWVSRDHKSDSWTEQFLGNDYQTGSPVDIDFFGSNVLYNEAETQNIDQPTFQILADSSSDSIRYLSLNMDVQNDGIGMNISWDDQTNIAEMGVDGKQVYSKMESEESESLNSLTYFKDLSDPTEINLAITGSRNSTFNFTFIKAGLPTNLISDYQERASDMMPKPRWISNSTVWQTTVNLDSLGISR